MDWIQNGGGFETSGSPLEYQTMEGFWQKAPCGGEFTSQYPTEELLDERFDDTINMVWETHISLIGSKYPAEELKDSEASVEQGLGYRYYISERRAGAVILGLAGDHVCV